MHTQRLDVVFETLSFSICAIFESIVTHGATAIVPRKRLRRFCDGWQKMRMLVLYGNELGGGEPQYREVLAEKLLEQGLIRDSSMLKHRYTLSQTPSQAPSGTKTDAGAQPAGG
eukprot:COSAG02_NODE_986_length_15452_cov_17.818602_15_plen_114_part_00